MTTTVAYVANAESRDISVLRLDPASGAIEPVQRFDCGGRVMPLAVSRDRRVLYASIRSQPFEVLSLGIDAATGRLSPIGRSALPASMCFIGTDRAGRFLLSAAYEASVVAVSPIDAAGIAGSAQQTLATEPRAHSIQTDPADRFAFAACLGGDAVLAYDFDAATGHLTPAGAPAWRGRPGAGPRHFTFHPTAPFVCLLNELDATVELLSRDPATSRWNPVQTLSALPAGFAGKPWAAEIRFTPDGRFLYASERRSGTLAVFAFEARVGGLAKVGQFATEPEPRGFAIDPSGRWLLAVGQGSHRLRVHAIDASTGELAEGGGLEVGREPNWVEIVALG